MSDLETKKYTVVIVGGGTAGITVAARLRRLDTALEIAVIEPSDRHYYQPLWTLIGAGMFAKETSQRNEADVMPDGVTWIRDAVVTMEPNEKRVTTAAGLQVAYDFLVVAPGLQIHWNKIQGLSETLGRNGVCSNYRFDLTDATWKAIQETKRGRAIFTQPRGAIKCGGAPQKICYLAEDYFRQQGVRQNVDVIFAAAADAIFAVPKYRKTLEKVVARKQITTWFQHELVEVDGPARQATFEHLGSGERLTTPFEMLHVTPPMGAPEFVASSPLANADGWVEVDAESLQHVRYADVFALGDAASLPTSKTGAAIRKQAPVLVANLMAVLRGESPTAKYDGYTSCPVVTGYHDLVLAEFNYSKQPEESFPVDQSQPRYSMLMLKKYGLPALYWHGMLKGRL